MSQKIIKALTFCGWKEFSNGFKERSRCFYKRFETPTPCACNNDKPGIQVEISISQFESHRSIELELCGKLRDGTWIKILNYSLSNRLEAVMEHIPRMLRIWEEANK